MDREMEEFWSKFDSNPGSYLNPSGELRARTLGGLKILFDFFQKFAREDLRRVGNLGECKPISTGPLTELYTEGLDSDQIWEQIQLVNEPVIKGATPLASAIGDTFRRGKFHLLPQPLLDRDRKEKKDQNKTVTKRKGMLSKRGGGSSDGSSRSDEGDQSEEEFEEEDDELQGKKAPPAEAGRKSVVDDQFFKLSEMEKFLEMAEKEEAEKHDGVGEAKSDEEESSEDEEAIEVDYFQDWCSGGEEEEETEGGDKDAHFEDFFDPPLLESGRKEERAEEREGDKKSVRFDDEEIEDAEDSEDGGEEEEFEDSEGAEFDEGAELENEEGHEDDDTTDEMGGQDDEVSEQKELSKHEKKQLLMQRKISALEKVNQSKKAWQMSGESTAKKRPLNSLLEEDLSIDIATRPAPVITEEVTKSLEDIIKQRIRDEAWDDVERRVKPAEKPFDYSRSRPLDQEKSKMSLAEVYEQEYVKQTQEAGLDKEDERHAELQGMMEKLFVKLDALSNFHFTPKPLKSEVEIVTNVAALQIEEVAPVATSDAHLLAPEELQAKLKHPEVGASEKTATGKKRERRLKKKRKRLQEAEKKHREKLVSKIRPGLGNKYSKKSLEKKMKLRAEGEKVDKSLRSSQFFARLQDEVKEQVQTVKGERKASVDKKRTTVQQYKL